MNTLLATFWLLAQAAGDPAEPAKGANNTGGGIWSLVVPVLAIIIMYQLLVSRPQRRDRERRDDMIKGLKKNDPVVTIGGILGSVVSVSEDGSEVTIRVDDNARLKVRRDAIREVIVKQEAAT